MDSIDLLVAEFPAWYRRKDPGKVPDKSHDTPTEID